jgi:hypothetical protein
MKAYDFEDVEQEEPESFDTKERPSSIPSKPSGRSTILVGALICLVLIGLLAFVILHLFKGDQSLSKIELQGMQIREFYERTAEDFIKNTEQRLKMEAETKKRAVAAADNAIASGLFDQVTGPDRPLVVYTYHEAPRGRTNVRFFIDHGLHGGADFVFIINGESDVDDLLPTNAPNIRVIKRENTCYDLGSIGEVLRRNDKELVKKYNKFIFINDSVRGPFIPTWVPGCWSDYILNKVTDEVKLVGIVYGCGGPIYIQSMVFATDRIGVEILLNGTPDPNDDDINIHSLSGLHGCYTHKNKAISAEVSLAHLIYEANYKTHVLMTAASQSKDFVQLCNTTASYYVEKIHPYETIFLKVNENVDPVFLEDLTRWHDGSEYSSWDKCKVSK